MFPVVPTLFAYLYFAAAASPVSPLPSLGEPALSPDRSEIVFVSGGDIWTVPARGGEARLLVSHPATESRPLYSPDGTKLAFTSTRTGNGDIYLFTFASGQLTRLTYSDSPELLDGWSRDGKWLYFSSTGNDIAGSNDIFRVNVNGGTPLEVARDRYYSEFRGAPSPDGAQLAFVAKGMSSSQWWRHGHSHLDESEIWIKGTADAGAYKRIVEEDAKQGWPMWAADGQSIFYTSDRTGAENIFRQPLDAKSAAKQVTNFRDGRLLWPSISYDGREIVFERNFTIWKLDTKSGSASQVPITLRGAVSTPEVVHQQISQFTDLALSPDGKKVAVIAHGDVFAASAADGGEAKRITHTAAPETSIRWSPDSNRVLYISARNGHEQLFEYDLLKDAERQLTNSNQDDESPLFSPDGKLLAFVRGEHELRVLSVDTHKDQPLASGFLERPVLAWSPDSKYIAYTSVGAKSFRNVDIIPAAGGKGRAGQFSRKWRNRNAYRLVARRQSIFYLIPPSAASPPRWRASILFLICQSSARISSRSSSKTLNPAPIRLLQSSPTSRLTNRRMFRLLQPMSILLVHPRIAMLKPKNKPEPTRVVFDGIRDRLTFVPLGFDAGQPVISPDGKTLVFLAVTGNERNLYAYSLDELATTPRSPRQLTSTATPKSHYYFTPDSKQIYYLDGGHVTSLPVDTHVPKTIAVNATLEIDFDAEKNAAFEQGWALLNKRFFDPEFHGQNWSQLRDVLCSVHRGQPHPR